MATGRSRRGLRKGHSAAVAEASRFILGEGGREGQRHGKQKQKQKPKERRMCEPLREAETPAHCVGGWTCRTEPVLKVAGREGRSRKLHAG